MPFEFEVAHSFSFYRVPWDGRDGQGRAVASGVYILRLEAGGVSLSRKLTLLR